jgi:hypothetical protein
MTSPKGKEIATAPPLNREPSNLGVTFACSVCNEIVADVYNGNTTSVEGLSDGINAKERIESPTGRVHRPGLAQLGARRADSWASK